MTALPATATPEGGEASHPKISFSQALTWDRCHYLWKLKYVDKWEKDFQGFAMELGTMGHTLLFDYYTTGQDHSREFADEWLTDMGQLDGKQIENVATAVAQFKLYRELFAPDADRGLTTVELEYHFEAPFTTPLGRAFTLEGYIDRMSRDQRGLLWVEDYKWSGRMMKPAEILMDPQLPLYAAALRRLGFSVHGLMFTQINTYPYKDRSKKKLEELFDRQRFAVSDVQLDNVVYEYGRIVDEMIDAQGTELRRSLRRECGGGTVRPCDMQEPCLMGLKGVDPVTFMTMSPAYHPKAPRPVDRQDGVAVPLQSRNRIPTDVSVDGQVITITI